MIGRKILACICVLFMGVSTVTYAADSELTLDTNDSSSSFTVKNSLGTTIFRAGGDGEIKGFGIMPIGSMIAWHKNLAGVPALPDGWVECNGQTVTDSDSPLNGQTVPDLNNTPSGGYTGGGRFLRGSTTSGVLEDASHIFHGENNDVAGRAGHAWIKNEDGELIYSNTGVVDIRDWSQATHNRAYRYTKPVNMSVVWIMRVK